MWTDHFAIAVQAIIEFIKQEQLQERTDQRRGRTVDGAPAKMGFAGLARAIYYVDLFDGNLQFSMSGDAGGGFLRVPVKPHAQGDMIRTRSKGRHYPRSEADHLPNRHPSHRASRCLARGRASSGTPRAISAWLWKVDS